MKVSDHKPVSAIFNSGMKVVDQVKYRKIYEDVMKRLDKLENEFLPQVTVDTTEIVFDTIKFNGASTKNLIVANTGQVPVQFGFIKKLNDTSYCKPWLSAKPAKGFVMPGDKCDIDIEIYVNKKTAGDLNCGQDQMYDILVLHLHGGKDIFLLISAGAATLTTLSIHRMIARCTSLISSMPHAYSASSSSHRSEAFASRGSVP